MRQIVSFRTATVFVNPFKFPSTSQVLGVIRNVVRDNLAPCSFSVNGSADSMRRRADVDLSEVIRGTMDQTDSLLKRSPGVECAYVITPLYVRFVVQGVRNPRNVAIIPVRFATGGESLYWLFLDKMPTSGAVIDHIGRMILAEKERRGAVDPSEAEANDADAVIETISGGLNYALHGRHLNG